jgi:hypothetical protein
VDPHVDAEQHERPQHDREHGGDDTPHAVEVDEIVLLGRDHQADDEVDDAEQAWATHRASVTPAPVRRAEHPLTGAVATPKIVA